jgi:hypothetical protein
LGVVILDDDVLSSTSSPVFAGCRIRSFIPRDFGSPAKLSHRVRKVRKATVLLSMYFIFNDKHPALDVKSTSILVQFRFPRNLAHYGAENRALEDHSTIFENPHTRHSLNPPKLLFIQPKDQQCKNVNSEKAAWKFRSSVSAAWG